MIVVPAPLIVIGFVALATKTRPSTLLRAAEDIVVDGTTHIARSTKNFGRRVRNEYQARSYAKSVRAMREADEQFEAMSIPERAQHVRDQAEILARSAEILAKKNKGRARRASRFGSEATA